MVHRWQIPSEQGRVVGLPDINIRRSRFWVRNDIIRARPSLVICLLMAMPRASPADHGDCSRPHERSRICNRTVTLPVSHEEAAAGAEARPRRQRPALNKLMQDR
jgi:hypothetical protein